MSYAAVVDADGVPVTDSYVLRWLEKVLRTPNYAMAKLGYCKYGPAANYPLFTLDERGNILIHIAQNGWTITYTYDVNGVLLGSVDSRGSTYTYAPHSVMHTFASCTRCDDFWDEEESVSLSKVISPQE